MAVQTLILDNWQPTTINVLMRLHHHIRNHRLRADAQMIGGERIVQGITQARGKRRVSLVIRHKKGVKAVDCDALLKSLFDGLTAAGLILDDDRHQLEMGYIRYEEAPRKGLVVVLEDVD